MLGVEILLELVHPAIPDQHEEVVLVVVGESAGVTSPRPTASKNSRAILLFSSILISSLPCPLRMEHVLC